MKSLLVYLLIFGGLLLWLRSKSRRNGAGDLQAHLDEQAQLQRIGNARGNANIYSWLPWWSPETQRDVDPQIYNPQTEINNTDEVDDTANWGENPDPTA